MTGRAGSRYLLSIGFLLVVSSLVPNVKTIKLNGNGYTLEIAISNQVKLIPDNQRAAFLQSIQNTITRTSQLLFQATDYRFYFKTVNILLPREWSPISGFTSSSTATFTYANADIRIEETKDTNGDLIKTLIQTKNTKPCGMPGEYILVLPDFFIDANNMTTLAYGDKAKVMVHEFAHYRYGVFEEYGFTNEFEKYGDRFPYVFTNVRGDKQINTCNNTEIKGSFSTTSGASCNVDETHDCRFKPDLSAKTGPTSSLMSMHFIPTVNQFCDSLNHDRTVPNKQNYWCRNRSIKTVLFKTADFVAVPQVLPPNTNTTPTFNYLTPISQAVYIVLDASIHNSGSQAAFNYAKSQIISFLPIIESVSSKSYVGIAGMSGQTTSFANARLGGYLTEIQPPIQIAGKSQSIGNIVSQLLIRSASGLLPEPAILDVVDTLSPFTHQSGSILLLIKLSDSTATSMRIESEVINLLNSRNIRLVTAEIGDGPRILERTTLLSNGSYFSGSSTSYASVITNALNQVSRYLSTETFFKNRRVQLVGPISRVLSTPRSPGYAYIDWEGSGIEFNFYVSTQFAPSSVRIQVRDPRNNLYIPAQNYTSWNSQYNIFTTRIFSASTGNWTYVIEYPQYNYYTYMDIVQILPDSAPVYIGGGGPPSEKPIEVEVYTSGVNGLITMSSTPEDNSFLIFASVKKGGAVTLPTAYTVAQAVIYGTYSGTTVAINLRDDGFYPDMLANDGTFTGWFRQPGDGYYNISVLLESFAPSPGSLLLSAIDPRDSLRYAMPIDQQSSYCCGQSFGGNSISTSYKLTIPFAASVQVKDSSSSSASWRIPTRIVDFKITNIAEDGSSATITWTAPTGFDYWGTATTVSSYRLVYSTSVNDIINENGFIPTPLPSSVMLATDSDVLGGSLKPLPSGSGQVVIISLRKPPGATSLFPLYFTMDSVVYNNYHSYPAPMQFIPVTNFPVVIPTEPPTPPPTLVTFSTSEPTTVVSASTTTTQSTTSTTTPSTTTSTLKPTDTTGSTSSTTTSTSKVTSPSSSDGSTMSSSTNSVSTSWSLSSSTLSSTSSTTSSTSSSSSSTPTPPTVTTSTSGSTTRLITELSTTNTLPTNTAPTSKPDVSNTFNISIIINAVIDIFVQWTSGLNKPSNQSTTSTTTPSTTTSTLRTTETTGSTSSTTTSTSKETSPSSTDGSTMSSSTTSTTTPTLSSPTTPLSTSSSTSSTTTSKPASSPVTSATSAPSSESGGSQTTKGTEPSTTVKLPSKPDDINTFNISIIINAFVDIIVKMTSGLNATLH